MKMKQVKAPLPVINDMETECSAKEGLTGTRAGRTLPVSHGFREILSVSQICRGMV